MSTESQPNPPEQLLRSVYTSGLPQIFAQLGISLVVSTYQAGRDATGGGIGIQVSSVQRPRHGSSAVASARQRPGQWLDRWRGAHALESREGFCPPRKL